MAKFFLLVFTILLSLSLGLFVGQNYLLDNDDSETITSSENIDDSMDSLSFNLKMSFNKFMDKIFANDEVLLSNDSDTDSEPVKNPTDVANSSQNIAQDEETTLNSSTTIKQNVEVEKDSKENKKTPTKLPKTPAKKEVLAQAVKVEKEVAPKKDEVVKGWVIQVAAFQDMSDAQKVEKQVNEYGYPIHTYKTEIKNQTWYRVNLGPFESVTEATSFKQTNKVQQKFKGAFVRQL